METIYTKILSKTMVCFTLISTGCSQSSYVAPAKVLELLMEPKAAATLLGPCKKSVTRGGSQQPYQVTIFTYSDNKLVKVEGTGQKTFSKLITYEPNHVKVRETGENTVEEDYLFEDGRLTQVKKMGPKLYQESTYTYDGLGRVVGESRIGSIVAEISKKYDNLGHIVSETNEFGTWGNYTKTFEYDGAGRNNRITGSGSLAFTLQRTFDMAGRAIDEDESGVTIVADNPLRSIVSLKRSNSYDSWGNLVKVDQIDRREGTQDVTSYAYDCF